MVSNGLISKEQLSAAMKLHDTLWLKLLTEQERNQAAWTKVQLLAFMVRAYQLGLKETNETRDIEITSGCENCETLFLTEERE